MRVCMYAMSVLNYCIAYIQHLNGYPALYRSNPYDDEPCGIYLIDIIEEGACLARHSHRMSRKRFVCG